MLADGVKQLGWGGVEREQLKVMCSLYELTLLIWLFSLIVHRPSKPVLGESNQSNFQVR